MSLLFNDLSPDTLVIMSNEDIGSNARANELEIKSSGAYFDTFENTLNKTMNYSEYVYYREDLNGNGIYPCGVLVSGKKPNKYEIMAAAYLGIPLIKLLPVKEKTPVNIIIDNKIALDDDIDEYLQQVKTLVKKR